MDRPKDNNERLHALRAKLEKLCKTCSEEELGALGKIAGALFALFKASRFNTTMQRDPVIGVSYRNELEKVVANLSDETAIEALQGLRNGTQVTGAWLAGYYLTDATVRVRAAWDGLPGVGIKCPFSDENNAFKHAKGTTLRDALRVSDVIAAIENVLCRYAKNLSRRRSR